MARSAAALPRGVPGTPAWPLAAVYALLVAYASLYPFSGWRWPPGLPPQTLLVLPWPPWRDGFDLWANGLGYAPLGLLCMAALRAGGRSVWASAVIALMLAGSLSYACEVLQTFLPNRHPSLKDLAMNLVGAAGGAALASLAASLGAGRQWARAQRRWFLPRSAWALSLLVLWPLALLFPAPVPLGLGQLFGPLQDAAAQALSGVPWASGLHSWLATPQAPRPALRPLAEATATALGLLSPCMLAYAITAPGWRRVIMALGAAGLGVATMTLSALLNFGPQHAAAWWLPTTGPAVAAALLAAVALSLAPRPLAAAVGLVALVGSVALVEQAPTDPYFAHTLQAWEQGRFVRFHGLTQWLAWLWPFAAGLALLRQLGARGDSYNSRP
jgi:VanZ family protein